MKNRLSDALKDVDDLAAGTFHTHGPISMKPGTENLRAIPLSYCEPRGQ